MTRLSPHLSPLRQRWPALLGALVACNGEPEPPQPQPQDPILAALDAHPGAAWGVANLDDDDGDNQPDFGTATGDDDDLAALGFPAGAFDTLVDGRALSFTLTDDTGLIQVWSGDAVVLSGAEGGATEWSADAEVAPEGLRVEFGDFAIDAALTVVLLDAEGAVEREAELSLRSAPLIFNHHLQPAREIAAVDFNYAGYGSNAAMLRAFDDVSDGALRSPDARLYGFDVWVQDELEFGTAAVPGHRIDVVVDSIRAGRERALDPFAEEQYLGPGFAVGTWGDGRPTSQDSFGNLEVTPPIDVDGVAYPFGRLYYGKGKDYEQLHPEMRAFLDRQQVQAPFVLDIDWLCVGHVDEFVTMLPDPSAPRGFRVYVTDTDLGLALVDAQDPAMDIPRYGYHGYDTVGEIQDDAALRAYNEDLQLDSIEPNIETLQAEMGLQDGELVRVPGLFERSSECGGAALALIPATVNLAAWTSADGTSGELVLPDPYFRSSSVDDGTDPVIAAFEELLPPTVGLNWVDDWFVYHLAWGEVHCGSNVLREQTLDWWDEAPHLVEVAP